LAQGFQFLPLLFPFAPCSFIMAAPELQPVTLHVYDLSEELKTTNRVLKSLGTGVYHAAVEVYSWEWSFGYCEEGPGTFWLEPKSHPVFSYRQSVPMGHTELSEDEVLELIDELEQQWPGNSYDLLKRNCCDFSNEFCKRLGVGPIPGWVKSAAGLGAFVDDMVHLKPLRDVVKQGNQARGVPRDAVVPFNGCAGGVANLGSQVVGVAVDFGCGVKELAKWQVSDVLEEGKRARGASLDDGYHLGDVCRGLVSGVKKDISSIIEHGKAARGAEEGTSYRFGDLTRGAIAAMGTK